MMPRLNLRDLRRGTRFSKARALLPYLLLPFFAFLVVSPTLGRYLVGLPSAWAYAHAPGCDSDNPGPDSPCRVEPLTVTRKWQERTGRQSFDNHVQLSADDGMIYVAQVRDNAFWSHLTETGRVTGQVWQPSGQGRVMWLRDSAAQAQTEDHPASRSRNALYALGFVAIVALIAAWRWVRRR